MVASCGHSSQPLGSVVVARNNQAHHSHSSAGGGIANWPLPPHGDSCHEARKAEEESVRTKKKAVVSHYGLLVKRRIIELGVESEGRNSHGSFSHYSNGCFRQVRGLEWPTSSLPDVFLHLYEHSSRGSPHAADSENQFKEANGERSLYVCVLVLVG